MEDVGVILSDHFVLTFVCLCQLLQLWITCTINIFLSFKVKVQGHIFLMK